MTKVRKGIYEPTCYLRTLESRNNDNKKQNFTGWKYKRNFPPQKKAKKKKERKKPKPIFIISEEGLQRARETRGIFCIMENHCFSYASFV